ncbi:hypothetical protein ILUMI_04560, partial [Ignelater luminosus]
MSNTPTISINGWNARGKVSFTPVVIASCKSDVKRVWGYLMINELLEDKTIDGINEANIMRATNLALEHSFVTPLTSLVLETPKGEAIIYTETKKVRRRDVPQPARDPLPPSTSPSPTANRFLNLPWLNSTIQESGILNTPSEGSFKLGLNETFSEEDNCPEPPFDAPASCKLLHTCPQVHPFLSNLNKLVEYACVIKN